MSIAPFDLLLTREDPAHHRPTSSEFKELRKQWRKAKKEESHSAAPGQSPPNANSHQSHAVNPHSLTSVDMQDPMSDRRRRMSDSSPPSIASYRASSPHLQPRDGPQGSVGPYEENVLAHSYGPPNSEYSLGPSRLQRDPTLLTPVNLDGLRDGKDI